MPDLKMGANAPIPERRFDLTLEWPSAAGKLDCTAFLLGPDGRVRGDADMVFYNQRGSLTEGVELLDGEGGRATFSFDTDALPGGVERVVVCATVEDPRKAMDAFRGLVAVLGRGEGAVRFRPELTGAREAALRVLEIYRRAGTWKARADGQGFNAGLAPLARSFGVDVTEAEDDQAAADDSEVAVPSPTPSPGVDRSAVGGRRPPEPMVDEPVDFGGGPPPDVPDVAEGLLRRAEGAERLEPGDHRPLRTAEGADPVEMVLAWRSRVGGIDGRPRAMRPSLGAFYVLKDGTKGALLPPRRGELRFEGGVVAIRTTDAPPGSIGESTLVLDRRSVGAVSLLELFAFLEGPPSWRSSTSELLVTVPGSRPLLLSLPDVADGSGAVLLVTLRPGGGSTELASVMEPAGDLHEMDRRRGWGLRWRASA